MKKTLKILFSPFFKFHLFIAKKFLQRKKITSSPAGEIMLSYANMVPRENELIHGGRMKLSHLSLVYPEQKNHFNILYVTSSAIPRLMKEWVRICKKSNIRIVWNQDGVAYHGWAGNGSMELNGLMAEAMHQSDWVIYQSKFCKSSADEFLGRFAGPQSIIYNCADTSFFIPSKAPLPLYPVKLVVMGTHDRAYRVIRAIEAIDSLRRLNIDAELNIAGRLTWPDAKKEIRDRINSLDLGGKIFIRGPYFQEAAPVIYRQSHILLHLKYKDPCPTVVIEAMACGIPVVSSMSGGVPELLGEDGGIALKVPDTWEKLVAPQPEAIAEAVVQIIKDYPAWSRRARDRVLNNFNKGKWLKAHKAIFDELVMN